MSKVVSNMHPPFAFSPLKLQREGIGNAFEKTNLVVDSRGCSCRCMSHICAHAPVGQSPSDRQINRKKEQGRVLQDTAPVESTSAGEQGQRGRETESARARVVEM